MSRKALARESSLLPGRIGCRGGMHSLGERGLLAVQEASWIKGFAVGGGGECGNGMCADDSPVDELALWDVVEELKGEALDLQQTAAFLHRVDILVHTHHNGSAGLIRIACGRDACVEVAACACGEQCAADFAQPGDHPARHLQPRRCPNLRLLEILQPSSESRTSLGLSKFGQAMAAPQCPWMVILSRGTVRASSFVGIDFQRGRHSGHLFLDDAGSSSNDTQTQWQEHGVEEHVARPWANPEPCFTMCKGLPQHGRQSVPEPACLSGTLRHHVHHK